MNIGGENLTFKELRLKSGQTTENLAKRLNIKESTYRKYEYSVRLPHASILAQMHLIYKCNAEDVINAYNISREVHEERYGKWNFKSIK